MHNSPLSDGAAVKNIFPLCNRSGRTESTYRAVEKALLRLVLTGTVQWKGKKGGGKHCLGSLGLQALA